MSEGGIEYYAIDGVPGRYFKCPKGVGKLSDKSCSKLYREAMSPQGLREGLQFRCRSCAVGAHHAGVAPLDAAASRFLSGLICARCIRPTGRLIRGLICVSCYNREREVILGRNAKGNKPVHGKPVGSATVAYMADGATQVRKINRVSSRLEAVLSVMRTESRSISFGWVGGPVARGAACGFG